jgi:hypothetical protein
VAELAIFDLRRFPTVGDPDVRVGGVAWLRAARKRRNRYFLRGPEGEIGDLCGVAICSGREPVGLRGLRVGAELQVLSAPDA